MKNAKFTKKHVLAVAMALFAAQFAFAAEVDFEVLNDDGVMLSYRITKEQAPCEVELVSPVDVIDEDNNVQIVNIPASVTYDDTEFTVTGVSSKVINENEASVKKMSKPSKKYAKLTLNTVKN